MYAAQIAASLGYGNIANYRGGSDEWFSNKF
jgi:rhodanese-related sulfurtransferase